MSTQLMLTLSLPVADVRAVLEGHDEHSEFEKAVFEASLSPEEQERRREEEIELENEAHAYIEAKRETARRQLEWIADSLHRIAAGCPANFHQAWFFARAYLDMRHADGDDAGDTDSLQNWMEVIESGVGRYSAKEVWEAIHTIANCARPRHRIA